MKKIITGIVLSSITFFSFAEVKFKSELLVGQTNNKIYSLEQIPYALNESSSFSLNSDSFAFRLGVKFTDNFSLELSQHDHGTFTNQFTITIPRNIEGTCCIPSDSNTTYAAQVPIDTNSIRFGFKGELLLLDDLSINARLGLAHWKYDQFTPQQLASFTPSNTAKSGNDIYYSFGAEYQWTRNFYVGIEYSSFTISEGFESGFDTSGSYKYDLNDLSLIVGWAC